MEECFLDLIFFNLGQSICFSGGGGAVFFSTA